MALARSLGEGLAALLALSARCVTVGLSRLFTGRIRGGVLIDQMYEVAVRSVPVMAFALTFVSLLFTLEFSFHMKLVLRQDSLVPAFSTVFMLREFGPIVTCFLLASRVGAAIAAEVATMKTTDQLDALRSLGVDVVEYLAVPRLAACWLAAISLTLICVALGIAGGAFIASMKLGYPVGQYFNTMMVFVRYGDFEQCLVKAAVFGTIIPLLSLHFGLRSRPGAEGVGEATTRAVVSSFLALFAADFLLTYTLYAL